jgi:hypothetical protein
MIEQIRKHLGDKAEHLLDFKDPKISRERLVLPGPDFVGPGGGAVRSNTGSWGISSGYSARQAWGTGYLRSFPWTRD